jgi:hypothetical protein
VIVTSWPCTALWLGSLLYINLFIRIRTRRSKCMHFGVATAHVRLTTWRVHPIIVAPLQTETFDRIETQLKLESLRFLWDERMIAWEINLTPLPIFPLQNTDLENSFVMFSKVFSYARTSRKRCLTAIFRVFFTFFRNNLKLI